MPSIKIVRTRKYGQCDQEFFHPNMISPGDRVRVTTYFKSDEEVRHFGVAPFTRSRTCKWCLERDEAREAARAAPQTGPHAPCCSSHGVDMDCETYRRTHFVEVGPCCAAWQARAAEPARRASTPPVDLASGGQRFTVKRCCNGCQRELGDVTPAEMNAAIAGTPLPDVRQECGCLALQAFTSKRWAA